MILVDVRVLGYPEAARYVDKLSSLDQVVFVSPDKDTVLEDTVLEFGPLVRRGSNSTVPDEAFWILVFNEYSFGTVFVTADSTALAAAFTVDEVNQPTVKLLFDEDVRRFQCL